MLGLFRSKKKTQNELIIEMLLSVDDIQFIDAVSNGVTKGEPSAHVMTIVAINILPTFMDVFSRQDQSNSKEKLPKNLDEFIWFCAKYDAPGDDIGMRRMSWFMQAGLIKRATTLGQGRDDVLDPIIDLWLSLIKSGRFIPQVLQHNIIWEDFEKSYFSHIKNDIDGMSYIAQFIMPKYLRSHPDIKRFSEENGFYLSSSI